MHHDIQLASIEVHDRCAKGCGFCYNGSGPAGAAAWAPDDLLALCRDGAAHGLRAVSLGGGEPLEYPGLYAVLDGLRGVVQRTLTTNGLPLDAHLDRLAAAAPDKVHVSIHRPEAETDRVIRQVRALESAGIPAGVNLLVRASGLGAARDARRALADAGVPPSRIVLLPMRPSDTPTPREMASVADDGPFQSTSCLSACGRSPRFVSLDARGRVAWCSYTASRRPLGAMTWAALQEALDGLPLMYCG